MNKLSPLLKGSCAWCFASQGKLIPPTHRTCGMRASTDENTGSSQQGLLIRSPVFTTTADCFTVCVGLSAFDEGSDNLVLTEIQYLDLPT